MLRNFVELIRSGNDNDRRIAVADLKSDLFAGQRGMHRHVNRAGRLNCEVENEPFVTVLCHLDDVVARLNAKIRQYRCRASHVAGQFFPGDADKLVATSKQYRVVGSAARDPASKQIDERSGGRVVAVCN